MQEVLVIILTIRALLCGELDLVSKETLTAPPAVSSPEDSHDPK